MSEKIVSADLVIELNVRCPHCDEFFDLMCIPHLDELMESTCPQDGAWIDKHEEFDIEEDCPECGKEISIKGINW